MKPCPTCGSEMLRSPSGWLCMNNMTCGQPIVPGEPGEPVQHERGRIPTRQDWRAFRAVADQKPDGGDRDE